MGRRVHKCITLTLLLAAHRASACSFLVTDLSAEQLTPAALAAANKIQRLRGPDHTGHETFHGIHMVHNLLHLTGTYRVQPLEHGPSLRAVFNGEIYNFRELGVRHARSDGDVILPLYLREGPQFVRRLRGEFAIVVVDLRRERIILARDTFGTKPMWIGRAAPRRAPNSFWPLWMSRTQPEEVRLPFGVASYSSALQGLNLTSELREVAVNTVEVRNLRTFGLVSTYQAFSFDLRQYKTSFEDWNAAFHRAMLRRTSDLQHGIMVPTSSGVDSGVLALALGQLAVDHHVYSIEGPEMGAVLLQRHRMVAERFNKSGSSFSHLIGLTHDQYTEAHRFLLKHTESGDNNKWLWEPVAHEASSIGTSHMLQLAKRDGIKIILSGAGGDEIYTDYFTNYPTSASARSRHSKDAKMYERKPDLVPSFKLGVPPGIRLPTSHEDGRVNIFPADLQPVFPWFHFFGGMMRTVLTVTEFVAGAHGMEGRYPFLDVDLVQEFLWVSADLKNSLIKAPLVRYMRNASYPYHSKKISFNARANLRGNASAIEWQCLKFPDGRRHGCIPSSRQQPTASRVQRMKGVGKGNR